MPFYPPAWVPKLPFDPPDSISVYDFILTEKYGRQPASVSRAPFTCGLTGKSFSFSEVQQRTDHLARGLAKEFGWEPNTGDVWSKVTGVFSLNTLDNVILSWATHRLGGAQSPANAAYSGSELEHQLKDSGSMCLFTCLPLLETGLKAAKAVGIPKNRVYILETPDVINGGVKVPQGMKTVSDLVKEGASQPELAPLKWSKGEGGRRTAYICYSSGTSGLPKGVMISHRNVIANSMQITHFEKPIREGKRQSGQKHDPTDVVLGLLPMSHIYALVVICHAAIYRGDEVVVLPKFEMASFLNAIAKQHITTLFIVPPIVIQIANNKATLDKYDLSSITTIFTGAAPLGREISEEVLRQHPDWVIRQGYGLTETSTVVCSTPANDIWHGSTGSLLPGYEAKLLTPEGKEVTEYDSPGELCVKSPSVVLGYLNNEKATNETFIDGWMHTGDEAVVRKAPSGNEHIFIVDRIKELIKVKGLQVAPAELEAHLLNHPDVDDCAVIPVPDDRAGEVPKAYVVRAARSIEDGDKVLARSIIRHVEKDKARHKWLKGGVEFIDVIPKSPSGKILRRLLRDKDREARRKQGAKL